MTTTIHYELYSPGYVHLNIFDAKGKLVDSVVHGYKDEGSHSIRINTSLIEDACYFKIDVTNNVTAILGSTTSSNRITYIG